VPEITAMALCSGLVIALGLHVPNAFVQIIHRAMAVLNS
jgi:hypothetical protein